MPSSRVTFKNSNGLKLAGVLDLPEERLDSFAVFAHCFTCGKDLKALVRISRNLAQQGIAVLRFDFAGIGDSEGEFVHANLETNIADLKSAIHWLAEQHQAPQWLIGHSLGGAAAMAVAAEAAATGAGPLNELRTLITLAASSDTSQLGNFLVSQNPEIEAAGQGIVNIGGRDWPIARQLIDSLRNRKLPEEIARIRMPHLILHSPVDRTVLWQHAESIFALTGGPKSLVTLAGADHLLLNQKNDVQFVADLIVVWSRHHL